MCHPYLLGYQPWQWSRDHFKINFLMINSKIFLQGLKSNLGTKSPTVFFSRVFYCFSALLKDAGFNLQQSAASSFFTYALPGQLVMAESLLIGTSLINIFIAVWLVNFRLIQ